VNYQLYNQILDLISFQYNGDKRFICKIKISNKLINNDIEIEFDEKTTPVSFKIE
jgi:hypothetical protein